MFYFFLQDTPSVDLSDNPYYEESFKFYDQSLIDALKAKDRECQTFFRLLALCHTVMPEHKNGILKQIFFIMSLSFIKKIKSLINYFFVLYIYLNF